MGNSQSSDLVNDDCGSLLERPAEHSQHPDHVPGNNPLAQPQQQQAQEFQHPANPVPSSQPVVEPSRSRRLPLSLAPQQTHVPAQPQHQQAPEFQYPAYPVPASQPIVEPPHSRLLPLSLAPQQTHVPARAGNMAFDLTADSPSTSPQRDHHPRVKRSKGARNPGQLVDMTAPEDPEVKKVEGAMAQQRLCGSSYTIDLTADDGGEDVTGSSQGNLASQQAPQKRPLPQSLVQHGAPPAKLSAMGSGMAHSRQAANPLAPCSSLPAPQAAAQVLPQQTFQIQQQQQLQQLQQQLLWQQQARQQFPTSSSSSAAAAAMPLSDEFFLNQLNVCDQHQQRYRQGMSQMEALMESGEYAGKKLRPEQLDKACMQRDMCAQMIERVTMQRSQCLAQFEAWLNSGQAPSLGVSTGHPRLLPSSLALNQHVAQQQQQQQQFQQQQGFNSARCVDHRAALKAVVENLSLTGQEEIEPAQNALVVPIMRHQKMALAWMCKREISSNPQGGILADDQGLGKTVSAIALIVTNTPDPTADRRSSHKTAKQSSTQPTTSPQKASSPSSPQKPPTTTSDSNAVTAAATAVVTDIPKETGPNASDSGGASKLGSKATMPQTSASSHQQAQQQQMLPSSSNGGSSSFFDEEYGVDAADLHPGGTLVVCPTSVLHQWHREFRDKVNMRAGFSVCMHHGKDKVALPSLLCKYTVVLTTYGTLAMEAPAKPEPKASKKQQQQSKEEDEAAEKDDAKAGVSWPGGKGGKGARKTDEGGVLYKIFWHRVMLDEAQSIKNVRTLAAHAAFRLQASHRWCMSGTPIQNSVDDLFAYFKFLRYKPYNDPAGFKELIKDKILHNPDNGYKILAIVLKAILLRRTKSTKLGDEPIVNLPPREQELIQPEFTAQEADFYRTVQEDGKRALEENAKENGGKEQYVNMLYFLLKMRQACNHPWLVKGLGQRYSKGGSCRPASATELAAARKLEPEQRARLLSLVQHPQAQCPVCADVPEDPVVATCGHVYCQQCAAAQLEGAGHEDEFLCSSCSAVLRASSLHSAAALQGQQLQQSKPAAPPKGGGKKGGGVSSSCLSSDAPWTTSTKVDRLMDLLRRVLIKQGAGGASQPSSTPAGPSATPGQPNPYRSKVSSKMAKMFKPLGPPLPAQQPPGSKGGGEGAASGGPPGAAKGPRKDKVIVFSQWTSMLDLLELPLGAARINFRRLDGTMSVAQRERAIIDFEDQPDVLVLLVSLKAAALGVNLTCANHVVLMDLWWNPTVEEQAIDRAHRIGQTRTVHVTRLAIKGTVEERILELQASKRAVVAAALEEGRGADGANKLTMEDLRFLFLGAPTTHRPPPPAHALPPSGPGAQSIWQPNPTIPTASAAPSVPLLHAPFGGGPGRSGVDTGAQGFGSGNTAGVGASVGGNAGVRTQAGEGGAPQSPSIVAHTSQASMPVQGGSLASYAAL